MRVIAGQYRSRPLRYLPGNDVRPTSDKLRETLFNVLSAAGEMEASVWIDLFAGSGAVGIEALSRGAQTVYFVDNARLSAESIRGNLKSLGIVEGFEVQERDAVAALRLLESEAIAADYVFLDPPYRLKRSYDDALGLLSQSSLLKPSTVVIAEHEKRFDPGERFGALQRYRRLDQGDSSLSFYRLQ